MDRLKKFFVNGLLMTTVALLIRYVSVRFNVYVSNKIGAVAMGIFTLVSSVYGFSVTLAASGIGLATTKLVSEALGLESRDRTARADAEISAIMKKSILFSLSVSSFTAFALFIFSEPIGTRLLGDVRTVSSLRILALSLPPIAISSALGGYFTALRRVYKNAVVQILGQALRILLCVILLSAITANDLESACVAIVIGMTASEIAAFLIQALLYALERKRSKDTSSYRSRLSRRLLPITLPVAFSAYMRSALVTVEHLLIPVGLRKSGASRELSLAAYGTVHSVVFPFVLFPSAISSSFAGLLVPEISESDAACDKARIDRIVTRVLKTVLIYSIGVGAVMMSMSKGLGQLFFSDTSAGYYIALIAPLVPIMYLDTSVDSILKGLGYQFYSMIINIADAAMSVALVWLLLPRFGILGYIATVYFTEIVNATLSITKLLCVTGTRVRLWDQLGKPLLAAVLSTNLTAALLPSPTSRLWLIITITVIALIYILLLFAFRAILPSKIKRSLHNFFKREK